MTALDAHVAVAARSVDARVAVEPGRTLVLLGANGAGKSTVLEAIAGVIGLDGGRVALDGEVVDDARRRMPARDRRIGLLSQDDALFPGMSVLDNVAFGPRARGAARGDAQAQARRWLAQVGLADVADRRPGALSGGQARRVAIARALAAQPRLLLLDEPFAGLDMGAASDIRALVARLLIGVTAVVSTHDALDAHALADDVAVMEAGRVVEWGPAARVLTRPRTPFAARMAARVLITGEMRGGALMLDGGERVPVTGGPGAGVTAAIAVRPTEVAVRHGAAAPEAGRVWLADTVAALEPRGEEVRVHGRALAADVDAAVAARFTVGETVTFGVPAGLAAYPLRS